MMKWKTQGIIDKILKSIESKFLITGFDYNRGEAEKSLLRLLTINAAEDELLRKVSVIELNISPKESDVLKKFIVICYCRDTFLENHIIVFRGTRKRLLITFTKIFGNKTISDNYEMEI